MKRPFTHKGPFFAATVSSETNTAAQYRAVGS